MTVIASVVYMHGFAHAKAEIVLGNEVPSDQPVDDTDAAELVWRYTGKKITEADPEDVQEVISMYEEGYFDAWEEHNG